MRKVYAFVLAALMVLGLSAAVYAEDGVADTHGGYQVISIQESVAFSNGSAAADAYCPDETWRITGGGFFVNSFNAVIIDSRDVDGAPNNEPDHWHITATTQKGATPLTGSTELYVRAICTKIG